MTEPTTTVRTWHEALNAGDIERVVALSSSDIEVGGPRGSGQGTDLLRQWFDRAGIHIEMGRLYTQGETVVVEQRALWQAPGSPDAAERVPVASVFTVQEGRVTSVVRYADLESALQSVGMCGAESTQVRRSSLND